MTRKSAGINFSNMNIAWLALFAAVMFIPWIWSGALWDRDETYYAEVAREMLESGKWLLPYSNYEPFNEKPAFSYWMTLLGFAIFGVNEFAARILSAVLGIGTVLFTAGIGSRLFDRKVGILSGFVLSSSLLFVVISRSALMDPPLLLFMTAAFYFYVRASENDFVENKYPLAMYLAMGMAVLTKGPIGALLPGSAIFLHTIITNRRAWRRLRPVMGIALISAVAGPWYLYVILETKGDFFFDFIIGHNVNQFMNPIQGHSGPIWIYIPVLIFGFLPWSVFLPQAFMKKMDRNHTWLLGLWAGIPFILFSLAGTKLPHYMLPLFPPLAIWVAANWGSLLSPSSDSSSRPLWPMLFLLLITALLPVAAFVVHRLQPNVLPPVLIIILAVLPVGVITALVLHRNRSVAFALLPVTMLIFMLSLASIGIPSLDTIRVIKPAGIFLRDMGNVPIYTYRFFEPGLVFYSQRRVNTIETPENIKLLLEGKEDFALVVRDRDLDETSRITNGLMRTVARKDGFCEDKGEMNLIIMRRNKEGSK